MSKRRGVYGVGINDAWYVVQPVVDGVKYTCPYYSVWNGMLRRGYDKKIKQSKPSYSDVSVCEEWFLFSKFRKWMEKQDWIGNELDKDILIPGNRVYSPEACCFIPAKINSLLNNQSRSRGNYRQGVCMHKASGKLCAAVRHNGKVEYIGLFNNEKQAFYAYAKRKSEIIIGESEAVGDERVGVALKNYAYNILNDAEVFLHGK